MATDGVAGDAPAPAPVNPAPEQLQTQVFVVREVLALLFVVVWLLLFAGELLTGSYTIPFWFHAVAVGVLGYALGVGVTELTAFRKPSPVAAAKAVVARAEER